MSDLTGLEIAVIGMSGRFPGARDLGAFWRNLRNGVESISTFTDEELAAGGVPRTIIDHPAYVRRRGIVGDVELFDASFFGYVPREANLLDPQQRLFLECAWHALEDGGIDPARGTRNIGVFAGAGTNDYFALLMGNRSAAEMLAGGDAFELVISTDKDYLATRVSYKLGLHGPSLTIQTACSTSLVAIHVACQSLLAGECDLALAGGSSVCVPYQIGHMGMKGGALTTSGECRAFDANADGTVSSDGVGVVLLRRLEDALAAGDPIRAVIRGSAINNDGSSKAGFTAPSVDGQVKAIRAAQLAAGVEPQDISYIEAHGTATALGDPIEVEALTRTFRQRTQHRGFCGLGSVKTNIGHLGAAAGVAGLIKTVLALQHRQLPPSLHFKRPNPQIDFAASPFFVNDRLRPWAVESGPRRAGVSSFGIGGTNAHVVLEEAPPPAAAGPAKYPALLSLSARSDAAVERACVQLRDRLADDATLELADVAYTQHLGRRAFDHRRVLLAHDMGAAVRALGDPSDPAWVPALPHRKDRSVVFMFSGGGSQHARMARDLFREESVFREAVERIAGVLQARLGFDVRELLSGNGGENVNRTGVFQPALFAVEYALAQLWSSRGVRPAALIGHSLGEYAAACCAGVFSPEDAAALIAVRGQLLDSLPPGVMLSVSAPPAEIAPLLGADVEIAAINAPDNCIASGSAEAIERLTARLEERKIDHKRLRIPVAGHSAAVGAITGKFEAFVRSFRLQPPKIPFISNVTGTWITSAEATDPAYWASHLRRTVRFADGIAELSKVPERLFIEVGPGWTLSSVVARCAAARPLALPSLPHPQSDESDRVFWLRALGRAWTAGVEIDWAPNYAGEIRRKCSLPGYPFESVRHWCDVAPVVASAARDVPVAERRGSSAAPDRPGAPRGELERRLAAIWSAVLGIDALSRNDSFFELGGHSLLATQMLFRVREELGVELLVKELANAPTIARLAATLAPQARSAELERPDATPEIVLDPAIVPARGQSQRLTHGAVLLTGATGYLGAHLLEALLEATHDRVYCLLRGETEAAALMRLREAFATQGLQGALQTSRIVPVLGDLARPLLGLPAERFEQLAGEIDAIYHCGAHVHFTTPYDALAPTNVLGTQEVLRLASRRALPVHHISTAAVYPDGHDARVAEDRALDGFHSLATGYAQSKWAAEQLVEQARARAMSVAIYRPGAVTGDTRSAWCRSDDAIWRMLKGCIQLGMAPLGSAHVSSSPADYVSRAIVFISRRPDALGKNFHLTAPRPTPLHDIFAQAMERGYALELVPYDRWRAALIEGLGGPGDNALAPLAYVLDREAADTSPVYATDNTAAALVGSNILCPTLAGPLLDRYIDHFVRIGFLEPPGAPTRHAARAV